MQTTSLREHQHFCCDVALLDAVRKNHRKKVRQIISLELGLTLPQARERNVCSSFSSG